MNEEPFQWSSGFLEYDELGMFPELGPLGTITLRLLLSYRPMCSEIFFFWRQARPAEVGESRASSHSGVSAMAQRKNESPMV